MTSLEPDGAVPSMSGTLMGKKTRRRKPDTHKKRKKQERKMNPMDVTIREIVEKRENVRDLIDAMDDTGKDKSLNTTLKALDEKLAGDAHGEGLMDALRVALYPVLDNTSKAKKLLRDYGALLDSIMRETRVPWPPTCDPSQRT